MLDAHFKADAAKSAAYLQAVFSLSAWGSSAGIPHMSSYRQSRRAELSRRLAPLQEADRNEYWHATPVRHASPIVRMMGAGMVGGPEGLDLFALVYVHDELGVPIKQLSYRVRDLEQKRKGEEQADDLEED